MTVRRRRPVRCRCSRGTGFAVSGTHTYATANQTYPLLVTIHRTSNGQSASATGSAAVIVAVLSPTPVAVAANAGRSFTAPVATFTDTDPSSAAGDFTASIDWGDGVTAAGSVAAQAGGGFQVLGTHTYAAPGSDAVHVTITRTSNGQVAAVATTATVTNPEIVATPSNIKPAAGLPFTGVVAGFTDTDPTTTPASFTASVDWGDGTITPGMVATRPGDGGFVVMGTHTYALAAANQTFPLVVTITRAHTPPALDQSATTTGSATVVAATLRPQWERGSPPSRACRSPCRSP